MLVKCLANSIATPQKRQFSHAYFCLFDFFGALWWRRNRLNMPFCSACNTLSVERYLNFFYSKSSWSEMFRFSLIFAVFYGLLMRLHCKKGMFRLKYNVLLPIVAKVKKSVFSILFTQPNWRAGLFFVIYNPWEGNGSWFILGFQGNMSLESHCLILPDCLHFSEKEHIRKHRKTNIRQASCLIRQEQRDN